MRARRGDRTTEECKQRKSQIRGSALSRSRLKQLNNNNSGYEGPPERNVFYYVNGRCAVRHSRNCTRVSSSEKRVKNHLRLCCNNDIPQSIGAVCISRFFLLRRQRRLGWMNLIVVYLKSKPVKRRFLSAAWCCIHSRTYLQIAELSDNSATNR